VHRARTRACAANDLPAPVDGVAPTPCIDHLRRWKIDDLDAFLRRASRDDHPVLLGVRAFREDENGRFEFKCMLGKGLARVELWVPHATLVCGSGYMAEIEGTMGFLIDMEEAVDRPHSVDFPMRSTFPSSA